MEISHMKDGIFLHPTYPWLPPAISFTAGGRSVYWSSLGECGVQEGLEWATSLPLTAHLFTDDTHLRAAHQYCL